MKTNLPLDADRLWADVMALADITELERPYTRRSFTALFLEGRAWLARPCGRADRAPDAAMVSKDMPSAPRTRA